jgi:Protein of unknown function (DUF2846)
MGMKPKFLSSGLVRALMACFLLVVATGCAQPSATTAAIPPVPPGQARVWFYREFIPSESLNMTAVSMNNAYVGYSRLGSAFYRDVPPGQYHIAVASWGVDINQSTNVDLAAGQEAFVRIESLRSWSSTGERNEIERDTFYARLIPPQIARADLAQTTFDGGS